MSKIRRASPGILRVMLALLTMLLATAAPAKATLPQVDKVVVVKKEQLLMLLKNGEILKSYKVALGRQPVGRKSQAGDGKTPEGTYVLDYRNEQSRFYRSLHISYPNGADVARARRNGVSPGSDIMIHGLPKGFEDLADFHTALNWTKGCIAVSNEEIDEIWHLVPNGTPIEIRP
jgi:murein L,D-transpeptidase YafK